MRVGYALAIELLHQMRKIVCLLSKMSIDPMHCLLQSHAGAEVFPWDFFIINLAEAQIRSERQVGIDRRSTLSPHSPLSLSLSLSLSLDLEELVSRK